MKTSFLILSNPCTETWESMAPNEAGSYCDVCAKTVVDLSNLHQKEIAALLKKSDGNLCGRVTKSQLREPIVEHELPNRYNVSYSKIAASVVMVTALAACQPMQSDGQQVNTEYVQPQNSGVKSQANIVASIAQSSTPRKFSVIKGTVTSEKSGKPIENAKITLVTAKRLISAFSMADGTFALEIPTDLIDDDNVIQVSYEKARNDDQESPEGYETQDYLLSKAELHSSVIVKAKPFMLILGGIRSYGVNGNEPMYIRNGVEVNYSEFFKESGEINGCDRDNMEYYYYFEPKFAVAIYGEKAKHGLFILKINNEY